MNFNEDLFALTNKQLLIRFGKRIKRKRINAKLTQKELAEKAGVNSMTIVGAESGRNTSLETFIAILRALEDFQSIQAFFMEQEIIDPKILFRAQQKQRQRVKKTHNSI